MSVLETILKAAGLEEFLDAFASQGIEDSMLGCLTDRDLVTIGVRKLGDRKKLLDAFSSFGGLGSKRENSLEREPRPSTTMWLWLTTFAGSMGSVILAQWWQSALAGNEGYLYGGPARWFVFAGANLGLSTSIFAWIMLRSQNSSFRWRHLPCLVAVVVAVIAVKLTAPPRQNRIVTTSGAEKQQQIQPTDSVSRSTTEVVAASKGAQDFQPENTHIGESRDSRETRQLSGIFVKRYRDALFGKDVTESLDFRAGGTCLYEKDTGFGLGNLPVRGPIGNSRIEGKWRWRDKGSVVIEIGDTRWMNLEGADLIDNFGHRWFRVR